MTTLAPPSPFVAHHPTFAGVLGPEPRLELLAETDAHEGPVYAADEDALYFTSVRRPGEPVAIRRLGLADGRVTTLVEDATNANGMALAPDGSLLVCEQGDLERPARISRVDRRTGVVETVADAWQGHPFNSPNDVVVAADDSIWFTDPAYGRLQGFRPEPRVGDAVYRIDPSGAVGQVAAGFDKPNGLAFSPGGRLLYVADNGAPHHLLAFPVLGARLGTPARVAVGSPEHPDGLKVDTAGRIYASSADGVQVFAPYGELLGELRLPGTVNFCFGGPGGRTLFLTTDTAVWAAELNAKGA